MTTILDPTFKKTLLEDGIAVYRGLLNPEQLAIARECYDWSLDHPSPVAIDDSTDDYIMRIDNHNPDSLEAIYGEAVKKLPFAKLLKEVWDSEHIWFFREETFWKKGNLLGSPFDGRTPWHQDTSYAPFWGPHWVNCWISFDSVPASHSLEAIRGSHQGTLYDGCGFDPEDATAPLWGDKINPPLPRLPDIQADRKADPASWDVVSFDVEPGDVVFVHPGSLHGGATTDNEYGERHTVVLRFFGDDSVWGDLPVNNELTEQQKKAAPGRMGKPGEPFRSPEYMQLY